MTAKREVLTEQAPLALTHEADGQWLAFYDNPVDWEDQAELKDIDELLSIGNQHVVPVFGTSTEGVTSEKIDAAREDFFTLIGFDHSMLARFRDFKRTRTCMLPRPDTFIESQRLMAANGIDPYEAVLKHQALARYSSNSIDAKLQNLDQLGIGRTRAAEDAGILLHAPEAVRNVCRLLRNSGLSKKQMAEVVSERTNIFQTSPALLEKKLRFTAHMTRLLKWEYEPQELVVSCTAVLGLSIKSLKTIGRILAEQVSPAGRAATPEQVRNLLRHGLGTLTAVATHQGSFESIIDFENAAQRHKKREKAYSRVALIGLQYDGNGKKA